MMKLLLVDDEQIEREGMQAILENSFSNLLIDQARNGQEAAEMARTFQPDLILMDIKMPGINGLEAVEIIKDEFPYIQFIMVTAYDTIEYLHQAIKLGVKDYLLKPSRASDIVSVVGKVLQKIEEEQHNQEKRKLQQQKTLALAEKDIFTQLLFDHVHDVHVDLLVEMLDIPHTMDMYVMLVLVPAGEEQIYSVIKDKIRSKNTGWIGAIHGNQLPIIVCCDSEKTYRSQATSLARELLSISKAKTDGWFIGIGSVCKSLEEIRQSYQHALIATMDTSLPVKYRFYEDVPKIGNKSDGKPRIHQRKEFSDQIRLGQWEHIKRYVSEMIAYYEKKGTPIHYTQQRVLEVLWVAARVMSELGMDVETPVYSYEMKNAAELKRVTVHMLDGMKQLYMIHNDHLEADTFHKLKQYIFEHSHKDISLESLGQMVELSPIYISKMFKEKLGVNYIDYLTQCRMEKAKSLLGDSKKSIKEITFETGYHDPNYFSKVFKKMCGITPMEYRKAVLRK
ncbi:response regulator [Cytobacillus gottheilii]|uniref:response regulator n=1 Tax=Cytobacillus gottheilii TaxID=859144 RepID=UPI0009BB1D25|nr:response regulator [Cytobacillus gottheilii]